MRDLQDISKFQDHVNQYPLDAFLMAGPWYGADSGIPNADIALILQK